MTRILPLLLAAALALAGCTTPEGGESGDDADGGTGGGAAALPPPIEDTQTVTGSADPLNFANEQPCTSPSSTCFRYPFTLNTSAAIDATLTWDAPSNDFDLYVFQEGAAITSDGASMPPGAEETLTSDLEPGDYELVVVAWAVAQDTFTVNASFSASGAGDAPTNATRAR